MKLSVLCAVALMVMAGCASESDAPIGDGESDFTQGRSALDRTLSPGIAVPTDTPIGTSIEAAVSQRAQGRTASAPAKVGAGCTLTQYGASGGTTMSYEKCAKESFLRIYGTERMPIIVYADHNGDGKVDSFRDESGPLYEVNDENYDGKVDRLIEAAERVGNIDIGAYGGGGWALPTDGRVANRIREDENKDGSFELESITAKSPAMFGR